jgi:hypothetical protein
MATSEYVTVDKKVLEEILRELGELKKLAKEQPTVCAEAKKRPLKELK